MGLIPSLGSAISGMDGFLEQLDVIGNNIANSTTTGFKSSDVTFQNAISQLIRGATPPGTTAGGTNPLELGLGTNIAAITPNFTQGQLQNTGIPSDLAINGSGLFILQTPQGQQFTRAGNFSLDANNNLVDPNGNFVQGFQAVNGVVNTNALGNINIPLGQLTLAEPTSLATYGGNFNSATPIGGSFNVTTTAYDSLGTPQTLTLTFTAIPTSIPGENEWSYSVAGPVGSTITGSTPGDIFFNNTGALDTTNSTSGGQPVITANFANGSNPAQNITLNFSQFTQLDGQDTAATVNQNGSAIGTLNNFSVGQNGIITGSFTNGLTQILGQVALANFSNPQGLQAQGNNTYTATSNSGTPQINAPNAGGLGAVIGGSLENSNVDLTNELTNLITTQSAFEASARVITTSQTVLGDVIQAMGGV